MKNYDALRRRSGLRRNARLLDQAQTP